MEYYSTLPMLVDISREIPKGISPTFPTSSHPVRGSTTRLEQPEGYLVPELRHSPHRGFRVFHICEMSTLLCSAWLLAFCITSRNSYAGGYLISFSQNVGVDRDR